MSKLAEPPQWVSPFSLRLIMAVLDNDPDSFHDTLNEFDDDPELARDIVCELVELVGKYIMTAAGGDRDAAVSSVQNWLMHRLDQRQPRPCQCGRMLSCFTVGLWWYHDDDGTPACPA